MNFGLSNALQGLPALVGVWLGILCYHDKPLLLWIGGAAILFGYLPLRAGRKLMLTHPRLARWLIEPWILSAVAITALATLIVLEISLPGIASIFVASGDTDLQKTFVGAVTAYLALVWTKDIADAKGAFWPSTQFKAAIAAVGKSKNIVGGAPLYDVIYEDVVPGNGNIGWDFNARGIRAAKLAASL